MATQIATLVQLNQHMLQRMEGTTPPGTLSTPTQPSRDDDQYSDVTVEESGRVAAEAAYAARAPAPAPAPAGALRPAPLLGSSRQQLAAH